MSINNGATTYAYNPKGQRVAKTTAGVTTDFIYDRDGHVILTNPDNLTFIEMYVAGMHLGTYDVNSAQTASIFYYDHADWLGTERARTNLSGVACETTTSYPFGDGQAVSSSCGQPVSPRRFTGKERDSESGLDNFGARYYESGVGRFASADALQPSRSYPLVLDQFVTEPQNWNKYTYSKDNPATKIDGDGHFTGDDHERIQINAMLAHGYSEAAAHASATADRHMDNFHNMASGVPILHLFTTTQENPQHGERADGQTREQAQAAAAQYISTRTDDAVARALQGDVRGALADLGQASHTAQDIVRHNFETAGEHPYGEAPATAAEIQAATQATNAVLNDFTNQLYVQGLQQGLSFDQIAGIMKDMLQGSVARPQTEQKP